ncbi:MAG: hypothetical protein QXP29_02360 [Candidatus Nezhaarchaeales archaeon]
MRQTMSVSEDTSSHKNDEEAKKKSNSELSPHTRVKLCPFHGFRICSSACNFYVCRGHPNVLEKRIRKGYTSEYFSSTLF